MNIGCTPMHSVTLAAIIIELIILGAQCALYLQRPHDRVRLGYLMLLLLMIIFNIINGLLPDPAYPLPLHIQYIITNVPGFLIVAYFPFFFYRAFGLTKLRFLAFYGVPLFLLLPFLLFFVIGLSIHRDISLARQYGYIVPMGYTIALLAAIGRSLRFACCRPRNRYLEKAAAYMVIMPWAGMAPVVYFQLGQVTETLLINLGFLAVSGLLLYHSVRLGRAEQEQLNNLRQLTMDDSVIKHNCRLQMLTPRETEIAVLLCHRLKRREIADKLFISAHTVDKHTERIFMKAGVSSREELLVKLNTVS